MTPVQSALTALVGSGLSGCPVDRSLLTGLSATDWESLYTLAKQHTVTGLLYGGLKFLPDGTGIPEDILLRLVSRIGKVSNHGKTMRNLTLALTDYFSSKSLHPVVMKGVETATYYPEPDLRLYGDVDLYFAPEEFVAATAVAEKRFGLLRRDPDGSLHFKIDNIDIDIHRDYFGLHVAAEKLPSIPSPEAVLLMHSAHILHHAIASGIGLRQMCDLAAAYKALEGQYDPAALEAVYRTAGLFKWNRLLSCFIREKLGVSAPHYGDISTKALERIIFSGGNFGHYASSRQKALQASPFRRKLNTAGQFLRRLPFSLKYAPRETFSSIFTLTRGNLLKNN